MKHYIVTIAASFVKGFVQGHLNSSHQSNTMSEKTRFLARKSVSSSTLLADTFPILCSHLHTFLSDL